MPKTSPEPWLRGPKTDVSPLISPVLFSFEQAREDLEIHTAGLSLEQIWTRPSGIAPVGFHLRHIAGSVDRLMTYLLGKQLDEAQMDALRQEMTPQGSREELLASLDAALGLAEARIRSIDLGTLGEPRVVGRQRLPTTTIGLLVHIAEHTQRHVGQAITTAKLAMAF